MCKRANKKASVLVIVMIFLAIFTAMALAMSQTASDNLSMSDNQVKAGRSLTNAASGLEMVRYWIANVSIPGSVSPSGRLGSVVSSMQSQIAAKGGTCFSLNMIGSQAQLGPVSLDASGSDSFYAIMTQPDDSTIQVDITGVSGQAKKTIRVTWNFIKTGNSAFNFGIATKAPLTIQGSVLLTGVNVAVESNVYIKSKYQMQALYMKGNSHIAGDVSIENTSGYATIQNPATVGGEGGSGAQNHVHIGVPATDFPTPVPSTFEQYCETTIDSSTSLSKNASFNNVRIAPNTNPKFSGGTTINGVLMIEAPNQVTFSGNVNINGIVVANGAIADINSASATNCINFTGTVGSSPVTSLPNTSEYAGIKTQTGTFLIAPGYSVSFGGDFQTINGVIAATGVTLYGNAGGTVNGSIINYDEKAGHVMSLQGSTDLAFNRSGTSTNPAGFQPTLLLTYSPTSYQEIAQ